MATEGTDPHTAELDAFWDVARTRAHLAGVPVYTGENPVSLLRPPAWAFGATPTEADEGLARLLDGSRTSTASPHADYTVQGEALPVPGTLGIVLDGSATPRALVVTTEVSVVPADQVERAVLTEDVEPGSPVVLERFRVLYP